MIAPAGPVAAAEFHHLLFIGAVVLIVIVPVFLGLPWILWRYRLGRDDTAYRPDWTFSWPLEILIWGVPVVIVSVLGWEAWRQTHRLDPYRPLGGKPVRVQAIGLDWKWLFIYPHQGVATLNQLVVPRGRDIAISLTADGPMMSLLVPRLGGQIYAMGGMTTHLHLKADRTGTFRGFNTQYDGNGFARQQFDVKAVSAAGYARWIRQVHSQPKLDWALYSRLAKPSVLHGTRAFGSVAPGLFQHVVDKYAGNASAAKPGEVAQ